MNFCYCLLHKIWRITKIKIKQQKQNKKKTNRLKPKLIMGHNRNIQIDPKKPQICVKKNYPIGKN